MQVPGTKIVSMALGFKPMKPMKACDKRNQQVTSTMTHPTLQPDQLLHDSSRILALSRA